MIQSKSFIVGAKVLGTIVAIHVAQVLTSDNAPKILELVLQIIVAAGGLIAILKKKRE